VEAAEAAGDADFVAELPLPASLPDNKGRSVLIPASILLAHGLTERNLKLKYNFYSLSLRSAKKD
jgi:hypothetical protein